ncbi:sugar ABC transporter permease [Reticulibacter mediterranei]|uniref:Sugar ABC transporter permease n=1 Tax=Reticulibacter mediterranei TaxID=2778369 RepID=A0A8J3N1Q7_9CHLR|nr:sugar ABC transporter permease [Reticulibacter mediterranei]GHO92873.1 sugar ABC transporter permease [Reticulibacter mediterranei]
MSVLTETIRPLRRVTMPHKRYSKQEQHIALAGIAFITPAALYVLIFNIFPVLYAFYLSFTDYNPINRNGPQFYGLSGYQTLLTSQQFWNALWVTVQYTLEVVPPAVVLAMGMAVLVNARLRGITFFRALFYLPRIVSLTAVSLIWLWLYSNNGFFNYLLSLIGKGGVAWLTSPAIALHALAVMRIWKALGGNMVFFLAGLQSIPGELYEAAKIDGAGSWSLFRHVTLPGLRPVLVYVATVNLIYIFQSFSEIYIMTAGGPVESTTTVNMLIYNQAFQYNQLGLASATAFLLFAVIFAFAFFNIRLISRRGTAS